MALNRFRVKHAENNRSYMNDTQGYILSIAPQITTIDANISNISVETITGINANFNTSSLNNLSVNIITGNSGSFQNFFTENLTANTINYGTLITATGSFVNLSSTNANLNYISALNITGTSGRFNSLQSTGLSFSTASGQTISSVDNALFLDAYFISATGLDSKITNLNFTTATGVNLKLTGNLTLSTGNAPLIWSQTGSLTITGSGAITGTYSLTYKKLDNSITIQIPTISDTVSSASTINLNTLTTELRPRTRVHIPALVQSNSTNSIGYVQVDTNGVISAFSTPGSAGFTTNAILFGIQMGYLSN